MRISATVNVEMNDTTTVLAERGLEPGGRVQQYIATQLAGMMDGYVPMESGVLKGSAIRNIAPPYEEIVYDGPYARRHFYNTGGVDVLGRHFRPSTFQGAPQRGSHWDKRAWADHSAAFLSNLQMVVNSGRLM